MCMEDVLCFLCGACCASCCINANNQASLNPPRRLTKKAKSNVVYVAPVAVSRGPPRDFIRPSGRRSTYARHPRCGNTL
ncbi:hypothetical protein Plhal304r1_c002g0006841 [Plasmopara halstedii]